MAAAFPQSEDVRRHAVESGLTWGEDPHGNKLASPGRSVSQWLKSLEAPHEYALFKFPNPTAAAPDELYGIAMERLGYSLALELDLPVPRTHLETRNGRAGSLQWRVPESRDLRTAASCVLLQNTVVNAELWPMVAAFDIWLCNVDRRQPNVLLEPMPPGTPARIAQACRFWLIDHGYAGLFPPAKFDAALHGSPVADVDATDGIMTAYAERFLRTSMPRAITNAFLAQDQPERDETLDRIRRVTDDAIGVLVSEIPEPFMNPTQADKTIELLKSRRDRLDEIVRTYWLVA